MTKDPIASRKAVQKNYYKNKRIEYLLEQALRNAYTYISDARMGQSDLKLKYDNTDSPASLQAAKIYSLTITICNDIIHSAHDYAKAKWPEHATEITRLQDQQKQALTDKMVAECSCTYCVPVSPKESNV